MSESINKYYRNDRSRNYDNSMRTSYFSIGSRKTMLRGLSRLDTNRSSFSNSFANENEMQCEDILCKRGFFKRIFYNNFNNIFNKNIVNNNNNCKKYGIILLIMFIINFCITILVFVLKDPVTCKKELTGYKVGMEHLITIDSDDCNIPRDKKDIDFNQIYVYYKINDYPFHYSNAYKQYSKSQLSGKISRKRSDLDTCEKYSKILINGINRVINPCGPHVVNVYNDQFMFFDNNKFKPEDGLKQSEEAELTLDESKELLIRHQEFEHVRNISNEDKLKFNDHYWLHENVEYINECKVGLVKNYELINGWNKENRIHKQLNSHKSGEGVRNGHFVQWLTPPPFPNFTKMYGILKGPITLPLTFKLTNNYDVGMFNGKKYIILKASNYNMGNLITFRVLSTIFTLLSLSASLLLLLYKPKHKNHPFNLL